jgi:hypothetical protein
MHDNLTSCVCHEFVEGSEKMSKGKDCVQTMARLSKEIVAMYFNLKRSSVVQIELTNEPQERNPAPFEQRKLRLGAEFGFRQHPGRSRVEFRLLRWKKVRS